MKSTFDPKHVHAAAELMLAQAWSEGIRPDKRLSLAEWADAHRFLSPLVAAEHGKWQTSRVPYLRTPMECLSVGNPTREVSLMWGAQLAKTELGNNWVGYVISHCPGPMMMILPSIELAKRASRQRLDPMFDECEILRGKIADRTKRDSKNNRLEKVFPGGVLIITGANSAAGLRSMPVRFMFLDEIDAYPLDVQGEGDPIALAEARTRNFHNYKSFKCSTPTFEGDSRIEQSCKRGDQCYYNVPCPKCGYEQRLVWSNLKWEKGQYDTVRYFCSNCTEAGRTEGIEERHKMEMLPAGIWIPTNPKPMEFVRSFYLSSLYSPFGWYSWQRAAREWEESEGDKEKRRPFVNLVLGEVWKEQAIRPNWELLWARREKYKAGVVPMGGMVVVIGVDVQKDRLELEVVAYGRGLESWSVDYLILPGLTAETQVWEDLDLVLNKQWPHESGGVLPVRMMCVDSGYATMQVYAWALRQSPHRVAVIRGRDNLPMIVGMPTAVEVNEGGKKRARGIRVWPVGGGIIKSQTYSWLAMQMPGGENQVTPPGYIHFPQYPEVWFKQLTSERLVTKYEGGKRRRHVTYWEEGRERNEALDCRTYARAAAAIAGVDRYGEEQWNELSLALGIALPPPAQQDLVEPTDATSRQEASTEEGQRRSSKWSRWRTR